MRLAFDMNGKFLPEARLHRAVLLLAVAGYLLLAGWNLDEKWLPAGGGDEAFAGAQYHAIARHLLEHGLLRTRLAQFRVYQPIPDAEIVSADGEFKGAELREKYGDRFWVSRLPLGALPYALSLRLFGDPEREYAGEASAEWAIRLVPYLATLLLILAIYTLTRKKYGDAAATWSAAAFALCPATVLNGRLAGYELPCLLLTVTALCLWDRFRDSEDGKGFGAAWLAALGAGLLGWFGLFAAALMLAESLRACGGNPAGRGQRLALAAIPLAVALLYVGYLHALGQPVTERLSYFWHARSLGGAGVEGNGLSFAASEMTEKFGLAEYLYRVQKYFLNHVTPLPLLLAGGWVWLYARSHRSGGALRERRLALMLAGFGLLCYLAALKSSYVHRYYVIWWLPFLGAAGGFALARMEARLAGKRGAAALLLVPLALCGFSYYKAVGSHLKAAENLERYEFLRQAGRLVPPDGTGCYNIWEDYGDDITYRYSRYIHLTDDDLEAIGITWRPLADEKPEKFYFWQQLDDTGTFSWNHMGNPKPSAKSLYYLWFDPHLAKLTSDSPLSHNPTDENQAETLDQDNYIIDELLHTPAGKLYRIRQKEE